MTKNDFLLQLINQKNRWILPMPVFKEHDTVIEIKEGLVYQGVFRIQLEEDLLFECLIESLKGIVMPLTAFVSTKTPVVEYRIDSNGLKTNYVYDDMLTCYYPGGKHEIVFRFIIKKDIIKTPFKEKAKVTKIKEIKVKEIKVKETKVKANKDLVEVSSVKKTFYINEPVNIKIKNLDNRPKRVVFECADELISPTTTEVYLNDIWNQEWFIKQSMINRLISNFFDVNPFRTIKIDIYIDSEYKPSLIQEIVITKLKPYETSHIIATNKEFRKIHLQIVRHYIESLNKVINKKEMVYVLDLIKACLNYNQQDANMRLMYIWILIEFNMKKEAKTEIFLMLKYIEYFSDTEIRKMLEVLEKIVSKEIAGLNNVFIEVNENSYWLLIMAKARYTTRRNERYKFYLELYNKGLRKSFLFAEVVSLSNKAPAAPKEDDPLYFDAINWAFGKSVLSNNWVIKIEKNYYQMEKSEYFTSNIACKLYELRDSKSLLRLYASQCVKEDRTDIEAMRIYIKALEYKLFVEEVEISYLKSVWKNNENIEIELINNFIAFTKLPEEIREFFYISVIENRNTQVLLFRRIYSKIIDDFKSKTIYTNNSFKVFYLMFEDWIYKEQLLITRMFEYTDISNMQSELNCIEFLKKIVECYFNNRGKLKNIMQSIVTAIGYEGLSALCSFELVLETHFDKEFVSIDEPMFLDNITYIKQQNNVITIGEIYKHILIEDFISTIEIMINQLDINEYEEVKATWFYYLSERIVINEDYVNELILEQMIDYYKNHVRKPDWLLLAINTAIHVNGAENVNSFYETFIKHDIIISSLSESLRISIYDSIQYLAHPNATVVICFRYVEDEEYRIMPMEHVAFGVFIFKIKLYFDEYFEYYIMVEEDKKTTIVTSSLLHRVDENITLNSNNSIDERINTILASYQLDDEVSAIEMIKEQQKYLSIISDITRI